MSKNKLSNQMDSQLGIVDFFEMPERLVAVSRIFARARKEMTLNEQKTFVYALSELKFTENPKSEFIKLDKKTLAKILNNHSDINHLSQNIFDEIKDLPKHSYIEIAEKDLDLYSNGFLITSITKFKNIIRLRFNGEYLPFFTNLSKDYITLWSSDIFNMNSKRSVQFYEYLRQVTDTRKTVNRIGFGVKSLKNLFGIPKDGKGSYMREKGGFDRANFEKRVIEPLCEDLKKCKMIQLIVQSDGKYYEKVKSGNRVEGYMFYWIFSSYPAVATAQDVKELQDRVDENPIVLKVAKDIVEGQKKNKNQKNNLNNFGNRQRTQKEWEELEKMILNAHQGLAYCGSVDDEKG